MVEIEAESLGKPLIATDLGFSAETINDGRNGLKFPLGNTAAFVKCVRRLWNNPEVCREMGKASRADYVDKYMPEPNYRQLIGIYRKAIEMKK